MRGPAPDPNHSHPREGQPTPAEHETALFCRHYITIFMRAEAADQAAEPEVKEPDKCVSWDWYHWPQCPEPVFLPLQLLLEAVRRGEVDPLHCDRLPSAAWGASLEK